MIRSKPNSMRCSTAAASGPTPKILKFGAPSRSAASHARASAQYRPHSRRHRSRRCEARLDISGTNRLHIQRYADRQSGMTHLKALADHPPDWFRIGPQLVKVDKLTVILGLLFSPDLTHGEHPLTQNFPAISNGVPWFSISSAFQPAPTPSCTRPLDKKSKLATCLAIKIGSRSVTREIPVPA